MLTVKIVRQTADGRCMSIQPAIEVFEQAEGSICVTTSARPGAEHTICHDVSDGQTAIFVENAAGKTVQRFGRLT